LEDITELGDTLLKNVSETAAVFWTCDATGKEKNRVEVVVVADRKIRK